MFLSLYLISSTSISVVLIGNMLREIELKLSINHFYLVMSLSTKHHLLHVAYTTEYFVSYQSSMFYSSVKLMATIIICYS